MYPVKNTLDYSNEMNRLFSKPNENDIFQTPPFNVDQSPFNLSSLGRSSSSADSTSPDSYPDISSILSQRTRQNDTRSIAETPFSFRRPIVGRKLIPIEPKQFDFPMTPIAKSFEDADVNRWNEEPFSRTPPNPTFTNTYELFPTEAKPFEFRTPIKNYTNLSPNSPSFSRMSPLSNSTFSVNSTPKFNQSPNRTINRPNTPSHFHSNHHMGASKKAQGGKMCMFCCKNGETPMVYMSHTVKERVGNKHIVTCPILRSHVCSTCGMTGDDAHTITYCPVLRDHNNGLPLQSTTITLKNTRVKSNGRRRF